MIFVVDTSSSIPVYAQIVEQVKHAIATGVLQPGDSLPSLRETSLKLKINPLTVSKAYKQLEGEGILVTLHGTGSFIADSVKGVAADYARQTLSQAIDRLLRDASQLDISGEELIDLIQQRLSSNNTSSGHDEPK